MRDRRSSEGLCHGIERERRFVQAVLHGNRDETALAIWEAVLRSRWMPIVALATTVALTESCRRLAVHDARKSHLRKYSVRNAAFAAALSFCPLHLVRRSISSMCGDVSSHALLGRFLPRLRPLSGGLLFYGDSLLSYDSGQEKVVAPIFFGSIFAYAFLTVRVR
jgi:hypothetical protein